MLSTTKVKSIPCINFFVYLQFYSYRYRKNVVTGLWKLLMINFNTWIIAIKIFWSNQSFQFLFSIHSPRLNLKLRCNCLKVRCSFQNDVTLPSSIIIMMIVVIIKIKTFFRPIINLNSCPDKSIKFFS